VVPYPDIHPPLNSFLSGYQRVYSAKLPPCLQAETKLTAIIAKNENHLKSVSSSPRKPQLRTEHRFGIRLAKLISNICWQGSGAHSGLTKPAIWQYCGWHQLIFNILEWLGVWEQARIIQYKASPNLFY